MTTSAKSPAPTSAAEALDALLAQLAQPSATDLEPADEELADVLFAKPLQEFDLGE